MIKTELRFILPTSKPIGLNTPVIGTGVVGNFTNVQNPSFQYYTNGWVANSIGTSATIYPSLYNDGTLQSIPEFNGWTWNDGYMITNTGSTEPIWQEMTGITIGEYYQVQFTVKDLTCDITPYLCGNAGTTVITDGQYTQYIQVTSIGTGVNGGIMFQPTAGGTGGITKVKVESTNNTYRKIDMYDDEQFNLTFQIQSSISNKSASYSKTIKLPGTQNNNIIFNSLFDESIFIEFNPTQPVTEVFLNKKIRAGIYDESIELFTGFFELQRVLNTDGKIEYEGVFYTSIKNIADKIGDYLLVGNTDPTQDISLEQYNHVFNWSNINSTWNGVGYGLSIGAYYPMIDYANVSSGNEYRIEQFKPTCYVKEVWDRVFQKVGYTYTSNFLNSTIFKSLVIPVGNNRKETSFLAENTKFKVGLSTNQTNITQLYNSSSPTGQKLWLNPATNDGTFPLYLNKKTDPFYDPLNIWNSTLYKWVNTGGTSEYIFKSAVKFGVKFTTTNASNWWRGNGTTPTIKVTMSIYYKRGGNSYVITTTAPRSVTYDIPSSCYTSGSFIFPVDSCDFGLETNPMTFLHDDEVQCDISVETMYFKPYVCSSSTINPGTMSVVINSDSSLENYTNFELVPKELKSYYTEGELVYMNDCLPDMKQIDFLTSVCNKFNLMFMEDKTNFNNLIIEPYDNFYLTGGTTYVDWGAKVDLSKEKWIERIPQLIDKDLNFTMLKDSNDINLKLYSDSTNSEFGSKLVKNPYYSDGVEKIADKFSSTMLDYYSSTNIIMSKIYGKQDIYDGKPTNTDYSPRMLYRSYMNIPSTNVIYVKHDVLNGQTGQTIGQVSSPFPYAGFLDNPYNPTFDLNYGEAVYYDTSFLTTRNLSWLYWRNKVSQYMNPNSKMVTVWVKLTPSDIALLNFRKRILLYNNLYRLNKIIEWSPRGNSCKVELFQDAALDTNAYITPSWKSGTIPIKTRRTIIVGMEGTQTMDGFILQPPEQVEYYPNISVYSGQTVTDSSQFSSYIKDNNTNYLQPQSASILIGKGNRSDAKSGIVIGDKNSVKGDIYFVKGHNNTVNNNNVDATIIGSDYNNVVANNVTIIGSNSNIVYANNTLIVGGSNNNLDPPPNDTGITLTETDGMILFNSFYNTFPSGYTTKNTVLINTSGQTIVDSGKTYINNRDVDTLTDQTFVQNNYFDRAGNVILSGGTILQIPDTSYFYIGDKDTNGSWRFSVDGTGDLIIENKFSGDSNWYTQSTITKKT